MRQLIPILAISLLVTCASWSGCSDSSTSGKAASGSTTSGSTISAKAGSGTPTADADKPLIDTQKLKSDLSGLLNSMSTGKPDTNQLKTAASDILTTDANVLSDSGINQLSGNSSDPAVKSAKEQLIKMRDAMGLTPAKLDSIRKAGAALGKQ